jgi:ubiquinone/menaquinone biosynthesis C-methylase UbiE
MKKNEQAEQYAAVMKQDWDERARQDARWFINTLRRQQSEEEFDQTGRVEIERLVLADLDLLTRGRDPRSLRLLEIGCGAGRMTKHFAGIFGTVVGVDVSGEMVRQASERLSGVPNVSVHETNGIDFSLFPDGAFDLIFSAYVYQHVPSAEVIRSNLVDAWRVLAPGGIFKFQTSGVTSAEFEPVEKNTWSGAPFPEDRIRQFAREVGAQLIGIFGAGTQYCWTLLRKRLTENRPAQQPRIELFGRTVDATNPSIPICGEQASLTLIASGLDSEWADCNCVEVDFGGHRIAARYVGPIGRNFDAAVRQWGGACFDLLLQIEIGLPGGMNAGRLSVSLCPAGGIASDPVEVELIDSAGIAPRIGSIMNMHDDGLELEASGPRSGMRILAEGLDERASVENIRVTIGGHTLVPLHVGYLPGNAVHEILAQLPNGIARGETSAQIQYGPWQSPPAEVLIK